MAFFPEYHGVVYLSSLFQVVTKLKALCALFRPVRQLLRKCVAHFQFSKCLAVAELHANPLCITVPMFLGGIGASGALSQAARETSGD